MEKREIRDYIKLFAVIFFIMIFISVCIIFSWYLIKKHDAVVERDGYAVISLDGYTDTIYFTEKYLNNSVYTFILNDGREVRCHKDNVVIYYDEDKE